MQHITMFRADIRYFFLRKISPGAKAALILLSRRGESFRVKGVHIWFRVGRAASTVRGNAPARWHVWLRWGVLSVQVLCGY